jgi:hypothetical protein
LVSLLGSAQAIQKNQVRRLTGAPDPLFRA